MSLKALAHSWRSRAVVPRGSVALLALAGMCVKDCSLGARTHAGRGSRATFLPSTTKFPQVNDPANAGESVNLIVRERFADNKSQGGCSYGPRTQCSALAGFDLQYSTMVAMDLAMAGFDVFVADLQGSGRSPRPKMDDPCNVSNFALDFQQQRLLIPKSALCSMPRVSFRLVIPRGSGTN